MFNSKKIKELEENQKSNYELLRSRINKNAEITNLNTREIRKEINKTQTDLSNLELAFEESQKEIANLRKLIVLQGGEPKPAPAKRAKVENSIDL
jgi:hypothetical protein